MVASASEPCCRNVRRDHMVSLFLSALTSALFL
jgi:hypothetical protein